jgi:hypothetical protein
MLLCYLSNSMNSFSVEPQKKKYDAPKLTELAVENAKDVLLDQVARGSQEATDLLNLLRQPSA